MSAGMERKLLLLSNDDGLEAKGLRCLIDVLRQDYDLLVVAPSGQRSAQSSCVTSGRPVSLRLVVDEKGLREYACSGTPADCVKLALSQKLTEGSIVGVVCGINHGSNAGMNALYSGTIGGAREGALHGLPAVALSLCNHDADADFGRILAMAKTLVDRLIAGPNKRGVVWNINFPEPLQSKSVRMCRVGFNLWTNEFQKVEQISETEAVYELGGDNINMEPDEEQTDLWAIEHGYAAITPIGWDMTDYEQLKGEEE